MLSMNSLTMDHIQPRGEISHRLFGMKDGVSTQLFTLRNSMMTLEVSNYRAIITRLLVPSKDHKLIDIVLGYDCLTDYIADQNTCLGMVVGRFVNRIANAEFNLNGQCYPLSKNHGRHCLHSGFSGINEAIWLPKRILTPTEQCLILHYDSIDGEQGFPGDLSIDVIYTLAQDVNRFSITYRATTTKTTHVNLTNHTYFNLNGEDNNNILDHWLSIDADYYTPTTDEQIPTGALKPVAKSPFDFRRPKLIGQNIDDCHADLILAEGYDHNYVLNNKIYQPSLTLFSKRTGIKLSLYTTQPGLQLYTGNHIPPCMKGKNAKCYQKRGGLALETQHFPDSMHHDQFPSTCLHPGQVYYHRTDYYFDIID